MAIAYVTASTGATDAGGAFTATGAAPGAAGRIIILQVFQDGTTDGAVTFTSATNIENLAGTDNAWTAIGEFQVGNAESGRQYLWIGRSLSTSAPTFTGGNSTSEDVYFRMYEFSGVSPGTTLATVIENSTAGTATGAFATSTTVADVGVTTLGTNRLALNFIATDDDVQAGELTAMTGETGGDWTYPVAAYGDSSGTDGSIALVIAPIATAGTINGGTDTITSAGWGVVGFALIPQNSPTTTLSTPADTATITDSTPTFEFTGTDENTESVRYNIQVDTINTFDSTSTPNTVVDTYNESNYSGSNQNMQSGGGNTSIGQSFTSLGGTLTSAKMYMFRSTLATGNVVAKLYAHSGTFGTSSVPTGAALATSDNVATSSIGIDAGNISLITFTFSGANQYSLVDGTRYVIAVEYSASAFNVSVGLDGTSPSHTGNLSTFSGSWSADSSSDAPFYIYATVNSPVLNKISGTDSGFVNTTDGGDTDPFDSGDLASFTVQGGDALADDTYYWRVRAIDPSGSNTYGAFATTREFTLASKSAALTGTITAGVSETDIVAGGKTLIITLTGDTWIAAGAGSFDLQRDEIIAGIDSAQSEALGWDLVPKATQSLGGVVRTSDTVVTITWDAFATYDITATETITVTIPSTALTGAGAIVATPTFTVSATVSALVKDFIGSGFIPFAR